MSKWIFNYTDDEMVADLRSKGLQIVQQDIERWSGEECWMTRQWMVLNEATGQWTDAHEIYRRLLETGFKRAALGNVTRLDILDCFK